MGHGPGPSGLSRHGTDPPAGRRDLGHDGLPSACNCYTMLTTASTTVRRRTQLTDLAKSVDEAVAPVRQQFEDQLDRLEEVLPQTARDLIQSVRGAAATQEQALRSAVGLG